MSVRIEHKLAGYQKLRSEPGVVSDLEARGRRVLSAAGGAGAGYAMDSRQGHRRPSGRWRVSVAAVTAKAMLDNQRNNTLLRALGSAR